MKSRKIWERKQGPILPAMGLLFHKRDSETSAQGDSDKPQVKASGHSLGFYGGSDGHPFIYSFIPSRRCIKYITYAECIWHGRTQSSPDPALAELNPEGKTGDK